nr:2284_t:CDS:2 [Entrophospora candida]
MSDSISSQSLIQYVQSTVTPLTQKAIMNQQPDSTHPQPSEIDIDIGCFYYGTATPIILDDTSLPQADYCEIDNIFPRYYQLVDQQFNLF